MFVELDTRQHGDYRISLRWSRDTGETQIVIVEGDSASEYAFLVPGADAGDAFRHPFRYAP